MQAIVVFDGECGLCNGFVAWLVTHDRDGQFGITGSDGDVGRATLSAAGLTPEIAQSTIVLWNGERALTKSDAVLGIVGSLGWPWRLAHAGRVVPRRWRDAVYDAVARRRARVAAEDPSCGVPPSELRDLWRSRLATEADLGEL